jgi:hypothetical protein
MKIQKASHKKFIILSVVGVLCIAAGASAYFLVLRPNNSADVSHNKENSSDKLNPQSKENLPSSDASSDVDASKSTDQIPVKQEASLTITSLKQSDGSVSYAATFDGIDGDGTCSAQFTTPNAKPVTRTTKAAGQECSASIPEMEFTQLGEWTLTVRYYNANSQVTATKAINVQ